MSAATDQLEDIVAAEPEVCREMFLRVLADAGGALPNYPLLRYLATERHRLDGSIDRLYSAE